MAHTTEFMTGFSLIKHCPMILSRGREEQNPLPDSTFTDQDPIIFPTGPHQRIAEELGCTRLSGGFRNYVDCPNKNNSFGGNKSSNSR
ncbi:hypothetical protein JHK87_016377 [Glycine soja]|nr:hypothetical protein JHK87_016377 [Glycine soja]